MCNDILNEIFGDIAFMKVNPNLALPVYACFFNDFLNTRWNAYQKMYARIYTLLPPEVTCDISSNMTYLK
jgi:hypothetical protein